MSLKVLPRAHKHHNCPRERCHGDAKDYQNYMLQNPRAKSKRPNTTRSHPSIHQHFVKQNKQKHVPKPKNSKIDAEKKQVEEWKKKSEEMHRQNTQLHQQLQQKSRRINELKHKVKDCQNLIKNYEAKIKEYENKSKQDVYKISQLQSFINENDNPKSPISLQKPTEQLITHYQQQIKSLEANQQVMLEHMEKYRAYEKEIHQERNQTQKKMEQLIRENERLKYHEPLQNKLGQQLNSIKQEIKMRQQTSSPSFNQTLFQNELTSLKSVNKELLTQRQTLMCKLNDQYEKEQQLKNNLDAINRKVEHWLRQYKKMTQQSRSLRQRNEQLQQKLQHKRQKHQHEKEEWARIFKDLMKEVQRLKQEISRFDRPKKMRLDDQQQ